MHSLTGAAARRFGGTDPRCAACGEVAGEHVTVERKDYHPQCLVEPTGAATTTATKRRRRVAQAPAEDASEPEPEDHPAEVASAAPEAAGGDLQAIRQRLRDRLADQMGSTGVVAAAAAIGISYPTLKRFRDGGKVNTRDRRADRGLARVPGGPRPRPVKRRRAAASRTVTEPSR